MKTLISFFFLSLITDVAFPQWIQQTSNTTKMLRSICFTDVNRGIVVGDSGTILKTTDGGTVWTTISSGTIKNLNSVDFPNADTGFAVGDDGIILKSINGGSTWALNFTGPGDAYCVRFPDANTGWVTDSEANILKTYDGGNTWYMLVGLIAPFYSAYFKDTTDGYLAGGGSGSETGVIIRTIDYLNTILPETRTVLYSIFFPDDSTGYAAGMYGTIVKTNDAGTTWNILHHDSGPFYYSVFFTEKNTGYVAGSDGTIKKTTDGGFSWSVSPSGISEELRDIYFVNADTGYAVGGNGVILKTTSGGFVGVGEKEKEEPGFTVYPNPARDKIMIIPRKMHHDKLTLTITGFMGNQVFTAVFQNQGVCEVDVSSLPQGMYILKIETGSGLEVKKIMVR